MIEMATDMKAKYKEKPDVQGQSPREGFDAEVRFHISCPSDRSNLHGLLCRKIWKDINLSTILLRASAQIRTTIPVI
jgi:hypothetical protein